MDARSRTHNVSNYAAAPSLPFYAKDDWRSPALSSGSSTRPSSASLHIDKLQRSYTPIDTPGQVSDTSSRTSTPQIATPPPVHPHVLARVVKPLPRRAQHALSIASVDLSVFDSPNFMRDALSWWGVDPDAFSDVVPSHKHKNTRAGDHTIVQREEKRVSDITDMPFTSASIDLSNLVQSAGDDAQSATRSATSVPVMTEGVGMHEFYASPSIHGHSAPCATHALRPHTLHAPIAIPALPPACGPQRNHERSGVRQSAAPYTKPTAGPSRSAASVSTISQPPTAQPPVSRRIPRNIPILLDAPTLVDSFHTERNNGENLARVLVCFSCPYSGCGFTGSRTDLRRHLKGHDKGPADAAGKHTCPWRGCTKSLLAQSLPGHVENVHLDLGMLHCPHCHETKQAAQYHKIHGDATQCPRRARPVEVDCDWCAAEVVLG